MWCTVDGAMRRPGASRLPASICGLSSYEETALPRRGGGLLLIGDGCGVSGAIIICIGWLRLRCIMATNKVGSCVA